MVNTPEDPVTLDFFFTLQSHATNEPLFPKLGAFECQNATSASIPLISPFLTCITTDIDIEFEEDCPVVMVASMITKLPMLCPGLECITLYFLPRDPVITEAVSNMFLACNRDTLRSFCVDSPLTEEAREVIFQLPSLTSLCTVIQGHTLLPPVVLPNLVAIGLECDDRLNWLQAFRGATLGKLKTVYFISHSEQVGDFLEEFKSVALAASASATLSTLLFRTSQPWDPTYRSLLPFTQLEDLQIEFSCDDDCSSRLDDNIVIDLARAMPKLKILRLGDEPCGTGGGITVKGLIALACCCRHLSNLCIHFQTESLVEAVGGAEVPAPSGGKAVANRQDCALTNLEVGRIPIREDTVDMVAMTLLQIFPRLLDIDFIEKGWEGAMKIIRLTRRISTFVQHTSKGYLISHPYCPPQ